MSDKKIYMSEPVISRYMHQKGIKYGIPVSGSFELTPRCNFNCQMCYVHMTDEEIQKSGKNELSTDQWLSLASDAVDNGLLFLLLTGGEPFIRKDFDEIYLQLKKMGLMVSLNSNGSMLDVDRMNLLINNPPTRLNVTLYGGSDATYERLCGRPVFHKVVNNIRKIREAGISVRLNVSVTPDNCHDIKDIYRIANELGIHAKSTTYMFPAIRLGDNIPGVSKCRFTPKEAAYYMLKCQEQYMTLEQLQASAKKSLLDWKECEENERQGIRCRAGRSSFWITWDGQMMPCGMMHNIGYSILENSFKESWKAIRRETEKIQLPIACSGCKYGEICNVCAASCYAETGSYDAEPEYICQFVQELRRVTNEKYNSL